MAESAPQPRPSRESLRMVLSGLTRTAACALVTVALAQPAAAEQDRPIMVLVGSSATWNSNLFLVPNNVQSDFYFTPYVGLRIDKPYAQQRFLLDVTETFYRYSRLSSLDANSLAYGGTWLWNLSPRVSGTINASRSQGVNNFSNFQGNGAQSFITTTENRNFNLDGWIFGGWHLLLGASDTVYNNSQQFLAITDYSLYGINTGVKYVAESGSSIAAINRWSQGNNFNQPVDHTTLLDNYYQVEENGLESTWNLSPKSRLNGRLTWLEYRYQHFSQRNFSGPTYQLDYNWASLSDKLRLNFAAARVLAVYTTDLSSYTVTNTLSFTPTWQVSAKTAARMRLERSTISYRGAVVVPAFPLRGDTLLSALLAVDWSPLRNVLLSVSLQRSRRSSNIFIDEYNDTTGSLTASVKF